eukprot:scaffold91295_cov22-Tisochrysis_lutea.AAC.1
MCATSLFGEAVVRVHAFTSPHFWKRRAELTSLHVHTCVSRSLSGVELVLAVLADALAGAQAAINAATQEQAADDATSDATGPVPLGCGRARRVHYCNAPPCVEPDLLLAAPFAMVIDVKTYRTSLRRCPRGSHIMTHTMAFVIMHATENN